VNSVQDRIDRVSLVDFTRQPHKLENRRISMWRKTRLHSIYSGSPQAKDSAMPANGPNLSIDGNRL